MIYDTLKKWPLLLLIMGLIITSCKKDPVEEEVGTVELRYDGDNQTAPFLEQGTHEAAAKFTIVQTSPLIGRHLEEVQFYLANLPDACELRVYEQGTGTTPGTLLYSADISGSMTLESWNSHTLSTPVVITGEDLWISIRLQHNNRNNSIGCDPGPANNNGDWLLSNTDNEWKSYRERTNQAVNINWNIRGIVGK